ncbi:P-loop NTPase [Balneolaceae bacterium ANBcel3]|nr:P-loop NTPase [Balneolaceae bacterium ANBcel3]
MKQNTISNHPFIMATVSGKGGVGKSMASINIADMLRQMGHRVAVLDADLGLSNCAALLNEQVDATVAQWVNGQCGLEDLPLNSKGLTLVTGSDDPAHSALNMELMLDAMDQVLIALAGEHDFIIIDTPAGSGELSLWALDRAQLGMILLVDEPTAISDVYRFCKYILGIDPTYPFASMVNFAENEQAAQDIHERFNTILQYFMNKEIPYMGFIPSSEEIRHSVKKQTPLTRLYPDSPIYKEFEFITHNILGRVTEKTASQQKTMNHE